MKNLSDHTNVPSELMSSLLMCIRMGEMSKLCWLVGLVDSVISCTCCYFQVPKY
jgi:hypothetical protein